MATCYHKNISKIKAINLCEDQKEIWIITKKYFKNLDEIIFKELVKKKKKIIL